jgi:predicted DNA-binding transcriptional regulator AlpA
MSSTNRSSNDLLTTRDLAAELHVTDQTVRRWRCDGRGPRFIKLTGNRVLYRRRDLEEFLAERLFDSTNDEAACAALRAASIG